MASRTRCDQYLETGRNHILESRNTFPIDLLYRYKNFVPLIQIDVVPTVKVNLVTVV